MPGKPSTASFEKLNRLPAYQAVSNSIREAIISGQIPRGELLPTETDLAEQFGVTRSTVREAIRLLETSGLLGRADRKRLMVMVPSTESASSPMSHAMIMQEVTFRELWQISMALEPLAATLACETLTGEDRQRLADNLERNRQVIGDPEPLLEVEIEFHNIVAEAARNRALLLARQPLNHLFYPAFGAVIELMEPGQRILVAHQHVFDAICDEDAAAAADWMRKHMLDFRRGIEMADLDFDGPVTQTTPRFAEAT